MATETLDDHRGVMYEIAEAIAPTWERRRAEVEEVSTPVREWMLRELRPQEGAADRAVVNTDVEDSFRRFATEDGYELPGVALCAVAS